ncbi:MAG: alkaline phosphatase family protein, partial [Pseudomonadota bacterium]
TYNILSVFDDFMESRQKSMGSIFLSLKDRGYRICAAGDFSWNIYKDAFACSRIYEIGKVPEDAVIVETGIELMNTQRPDVMITAISRFDQVAHKYQPGSKEYYDELLRSDGLARKAYASLPEGWNFMVFGDHGHDELGRHVAGLDIPAVYVYSGPAFRKGLRKDIDIRSHYFILAHLFNIGVAREPVDDNIEEIFRTHGTAFSKKPAPRAQGREKRMVWPTELLYLAMFMIMGAITRAAALKKWVPVKVLLAAGAAAVLLLWLEGLGYVWLKTRIAQQPWWYDYILVAVELGACWAAAGLWRKDAFPARLFRACLLFFSFTLFFHLPTVYNFGDTRYIMHGVFATILCLAVVLVLLHRAGEKIDYRRAAFLLASACLLVCMNIDIKVSNFQFRHLYWSKALFNVIHPSMLWVPLTGFFCAVLFNFRRTGIVAFLILQSLTLAGPRVPAWAYAVLFIFTAALLLPPRMKPSIMRKIGNEWAALFAIVMMLYFLDFSLSRMSEIVVVLLIGLMVMKSIRIVLDAGDIAFREVLTALAAVAMLLLGIFTIWTSMGMRFSGLEFSPVLIWLPTGMFYELWFVIFFLVVYFYLIPAFALSSMLDKLVPAAKPVLRSSIFLLGTGKIIGVGIFIRAMMLNNPSQFLLRDAMEELLLWFAVMGAAACICLLGRGGKPMEEH